MDEEPRFEPPLRPDGRWINYLANIPVFDRAATATVERICCASTFLLYREGDLISKEGAPSSHMFFLLEGTVRVFQRDAQGIEYTPKIFGAPAHCADLAGLCRADSYRSSIEALTPCVAARVEFQVLERCLEADHGLALAWLRSVARQHLLTIDHDRQNMFGGLAARIANVLLGYAEFFAPSGAGLQPIDHPLSYAKLARQVGCTRRAAIRVLQELAELDAVESGHAIWRVDRLALERARVPGVLGIGYRLEGDASGVPDDDAGEDPDAMPAGRVNLETQPSPAADR